jgi:hypothetical protein
MDTWELLIPMMPMHRPSEAPQITSREQAVQLIADLGVAMDDLLAVLAEETALVRDGHLRRARDLSDIKSDLAAVYTRLMLLARDEVATLSYFLPRETEDLKRRHELFRAEVQINLAVLETAREVAEDMVRGVANDTEGETTPAYG